MSVDRDIANARERLAATLAATARAADDALARLEGSWSRRLDAQAAALTQAVTEVATDANPGAFPGGRVAARMLAPWTDPLWADPTPGDAPLDAARLVRIGVERFPTVAGPVHERLAVPALFPLLEGGGLVLRAQGEALRLANAAMESVAWRVLTAVPAGRVLVRAIDAPGLGASLGHLLRLPESVRGPKVWHDAREIEAGLDELIERMSTIIQQALRNRYPTIDDYNRDAGSVPEPYRLLLVSGFPHGFRASSAARLFDIARNGPRVGVYVLMTEDASVARLRDLDYADRDQRLTVAVGDGAGFTLTRPGFPFPTQVTLDPAPPDALVDPLVKLLATGAAAAADVRLEFARLLPATWWTGSSAGGIEVPVGQRGPQEPVVFAFGKADVHHALVGGRTGSGKTVLLHALIGGLCARYGPDELELYLVDFKEGVEFRLYRDLPHARVVAIQSEREFGVSVLEGLQKELERRGERFRDEGVPNLARWREAHPEEPLPRVLLIVDEFQKLFEGGGELAWKARDLVTDLVRRGRSFGIHVVLASQTVASEADLPDTTLGQIALRIALMMSEADSHRVLGKDNDGARYLTRPGQAIYNEKNGLPDHNRTFQVAWISDEQALAHVQALARRAGPRARPAIVFDGHSAVRVEDNPQLAELVAARPTKVPRWYEVFLGAPTRVQEGHVTWRMRRQSRGNLLVAGNDAQAAFNLLTIGMAGVVAHWPRGVGRLRVLNLTNVDDEVHERFDGWAGLERAFGVPVELGGRNDVAELVRAAAAELETRRAAAGVRTVGARELPPPELLVIFGLQHARALEKGGMKPPEALAGLLRLLVEGPDLGLHVAAWVDAWPAAQRFFGSAEVAEFGGRVAITGGDALGVLGVPFTNPPVVRRNYALLVADDTRPAVTKVRTYAAPSVDAFLAGLAAGPPAGAQP